MMGKREILTALAGPNAGFTGFEIIIDLERSNDFERAYQIAESMASCYKDDPYFVPSFRKIRAAYAARDVALMWEGLASLCIDIINR